MQRLLAGLAALAMLVSGCDAGEWVGGSPDDAGRIARDFLAALETGDHDAAWALVYPRNRTARFNDDRAAFDEVVDGIDLSGVAWEVSTAGVHDGHYHVSVRIDPRAVDDDLGVFLQVTSNRVQVQVDIEPLWGESGVLGG